MQFISTLLALSALLITSTFSSPTAGHGYGYPPPPPPPPSNTNDQENYCSAGTAYCCSAGFDGTTCLEGGTTQCNENSICCSEAGEDDDQQCIIDAGLAGPVTFVDSPEEEFI